MATLRLGYHGNPALILPHMVVSLTKTEEDEYFKCMNDPLYFIRNYVQIVQASGLNKFIPYTYQEDMVKAFMTHRFSICKIPRQYGKSTLMCAYILHQVLFNENFVVAIICDKKDLAKELLSRIKLAYEHLPNFLKQAIIGWNKGDIELANGSKIKTFAASARGVAGNSINLLYLDEFAHVPENQAQAFYAGAYPVITSFPDSKVIITSTPMGLNMFYEFWDKATRKVNDYFPIEVHWSAIPGRDQKWKEETIARTSAEQFAVEFECVFEETKVCVDIPNIGIKWVTIKELYNMMEEKVYVYKLTRTDNKEYIGITTDMKSRIIEHKRSKRFNLGIKEVQILLETFSYQEAEEKEEKFIKQYDTWKNGLNNTRDGKATRKGKTLSNKGFTYSDESRRKMSDAKKNYVPWNKGKKYKLDANRKGRVFSKKYSSETVKEFLLLYKSRPELSEANTIQKNGILLSYDRAFAKIYANRFGVSVNGMLKILRGDSILWKELYDTILKV